MLQMEFNKVVQRGYDDSGSVQVSFMENSMTNTKNAHKKIIRVSH